MKKTLIIAEAGPNHNGKLNLAFKLVDKAKQCGADIIKFQTSIPEDHISVFAKKAKYQINKKKKETQLQMAKKFSLTFNEFKKIKKYCGKKKIEFLSTAFGLKSIDFLDSLNIKRYKIPSGEINNYPYLRKIAKKNKEIILSTGMASLIEIKNAIKIIEKYSKKKIKISILHCTTLYPAPKKYLNLNVITNLRRIFKQDIGYSDHSTGILSPVIAVSLGATIIEKHFTLNKKMTGPDHKTSLEPKEFKQLVDVIRKTEISLGSHEKKITNCEKKNKIIARNSIFARKKINKNQKFTEDNLIVKRPATGISPMLWKKIIGKKAKKIFLKDDLIKL